MTDLELAWAAGFIDGEGAIEMAYGSPKRQVYVRVTVTQSDPRALERLAGMFGGKVRLQSGQNGKYKRPHFKWQLSSRPAIAVLQAIRPYLVIKDHHADVALAFARECMTKRSGWNLGIGRGVGQSLSAEERAKRESFRGQMRVLQMKGPKAKARGA